MTKTEKKQEILERIEKIKKEFKDNGHVLDGRKFAKIFHYKTEMSFYSSSRKIRNFETFLTIFEMAINHQASKNMKP